MTALLALLGAVIAAAILWEVFNDLFHPAGSGALTLWLGRGLFRLLRGSRVMPLAGPLTIVLVIGVWVMALVFAFTLIYYGPFPADFRTSTGEVPPGSPRFLSSAYFSFSTLTTLGFGDVVPHSVWMRYVSTVEGLIGFGLLTASVSSIVLLYPALSRMRRLARGIAHVVAAERQSGVRLADAGSDVMLAELAREVTEARIDLVHFPVVYFFASNDPDATIARWTRELERLAAEGSSPHAAPRVRLAAHALDASLSDFAALLADRFVDARPEPRRAVFEAFAADHAVRLA